MTTLFEVMWLKECSAQPSPAQLQSKNQSGYLAIFAVPDCRASAWPSPCPSPLESDTRYHSGYSDHF